MLRLLNLEPYDGFGVEIDSGKNIHSNFIKFIPMKIVAFLFLLPLLNTGNYPKGLKISPELISLVIEKNTTDAELKSIKHELWDQAGISFDVENLKRSAKGQIEQIAIAVDCHDGFKGKADHTFMKRKSRIGFYRDYRPDMAAIMIGEIRGKDYKHIKHAKHIKH